MPPKRATPSDGEETRSAPPPSAPCESPQIPNHASPRALGRDAPTGAHVFVLPDGRELGYRVFHVHGRKHVAARARSPDAPSPLSPSPRGGPPASPRALSPSLPTASSSASPLEAGLKGALGAAEGGAGGDPPERLRAASPRPGAGADAGVASRSLGAAADAGVGSRPAGAAASPPPAAAAPLPPASSVRPYDDVIVYLHGFWSSSGEARAMQSIVLPREEGATVVAVDRPGYGRSSPTEAVGPEAFAMDLLLLLGHLRVDRTFVMGTSGGSPYAVTLCARLGGRARGLALLVPLLPTPRLKGSGGPGGVLHWPSVVRARLRAGQALTALLPQDFLLRVAGFPEADLEVVREGGTGEALRANAAEGQAHSGVEGPLRDLWTFTQDGEATLPFAQVRCRATVWAAEEDSLTPPAMAEAYARLLPDAQLHVVAGKGHLSLPFTVGAGLLEELLDFDSERER